MQIIILTDRHHRRMDAGVQWLVLMATGVALLLCAALYAGFRTGVSQAPLARADDGFERTVAALRQRHELDQARAGMAAEVNLMASRLATLEARLVEVDAAAEAAARTAGLSSRELRAAPEPDSDAAVTAPTASHLAQLFERIDAAAQRLRLQLPAMRSLEYALAEQRVMQRTMPAGWPVAKGWVSSSFGPRRDPVSGKRAFHDGLDFAGRYKTPVLAVADGVVSFAGKRRGYGNLVQIEHGRGLATRYAHNQKNLVAPGDSVRRGEVIALMGSTGRSTGAHVHLEVWINGKPVDPKPYASRTGAALLAAPD